MGLTPMMQQYIEVKEKVKDCILFFRLGDFYEMFFEDAEIASKELELVLTGRDCGLENRAPMCGIPYHAAKSYIGRLVSRGHKVAICEQLEDPSLAKGIVKRDIIKIITPGTFTDTSFLEETKNNYIMGIYIDKDMDFCGMCFADISTGDFECTNSRYNINLILDEISKYNPKEIVIQDNIKSDLISELKHRFNTALTEKEDKYFKENFEENLSNQFRNIKELSLNKVVLCCCNGLLKYILDTQKVSLSHINELQYYNILSYLSIDGNSRRNLELTETLREKSKKGSLLWVLDKTSTAMGGRLLRKWIEQPLVEKIEIENRLNALEELTSKISMLEDLKEKLKDIYDIERLVGKISSKSVNAKELLSLKKSISNIPCIKEIIKNSKSNLIYNIYENLDELKDIYEVLDKSILENPSLSVKEGNIIKEGYNNEIDELRGAKAHGKEWIAKLESEEKELTGIKSLKVGYNKVFGYYIEVTKTNIELVPQDRYIRKQTLANAERYITPELKEVESKILGAEEKLITLEYDLFVQIRNNIEKQIDRMKKSAKLLAELDCLNSLSTVALENNYTKPKINTSGAINIIEGRHPVVEKMLSTGSFVGNDAFIDTLDSQLILITGPNMAGKSTYMRQVALITLMAQIGSFVPAKDADISICDKVFTRIGASDDLAAGKSTFMVEMWEVSNILKNATNKSLVLLDEVGRGTSTYDGLSIAWAVIEYICKTEDLRCKTLFATHYHELTKLEELIKGVKNYSVAVKEIEGDIVFLRKIIPGGADQSYGIEVAKLAGLPNKLLNRAREILDELELENNKSNSKKEKCYCDKVKETAVTKDQKISSQLSINDIVKDNVIREILDIDILNMNPMQAFNKLYELTNKVKKL